MTLTAEEWYHKVKRMKEEWNIRKRPKLFCHHEYIKVDDYPAVIRERVKFPYGEVDMVDSVSLHQDIDTYYIEVWKCVKCGGYHLYSNSKYE